MISGKPLASSRRRSRRLRGICDGPASGVVALAVALADTLQQGSFFVGEAMQADLVKSSEDIVDLPLFFILNFASSA